MDSFACGELLDDPPSLGCYGGQDGLLGLNSEKSKMDILHSEIEKGILDNSSWMIFALCLL